MLAVVATVAKL